MIDNNQKSWQFVGIFLLFGLMVTVYPVLGYMDRDAERQMYQQERANRQRMEQENRERERAERERLLQQRRTTTSQRRDNTVNLTQKPQLSGEAAESFRNIESNLKGILESVNRNQRPQESFLENNDRLLLENRRNVQDYDENQQAVYMLLQAWTDYYQGDLPTAMNRALRAVKVDETYGDAWISAAIFCMLNDKKPMMPRPPRPVRTTSRNDDEIRTETSQPQIRQGVLGFELTALRPEMFSESFQQMDYQKLSDQQGSYQPGSDTLCLLFWQSGQSDDQEVDDDNGVGQDLTVDRMPLDVRTRQMQPNLSSTTSEQIVDRQREYFQQLAGVCRQESQLKFFEINTNSPEQTQEMPASKVPLIPIAELDLEPQQYTELNSADPFMLILNPEGKLRYAGPSADFVPAFILTAMTGIDIDVQNMSQVSQQSAGQDSRGNLRRPLLAGQSADPNKVSTDPNLPVLDQPQQIPAVKIVRPSNLSLEECYDAEKLLALAQMKIEEGNKLRAASPFQAGIDACREVLKKYPNTEYAKQAREWLRKVPPRLQPRFNITSEELGY